MNGKIFNPAWASFMHSRHKTIFKYQAIDTIGRPRQFQKLCAFVLKSQKTHAKFDWPYYAELYFGHR